MLSRRRLLKKIKYRYKIKCGNITTNDYNLEYKLKSGFANLTTQTGVKKSSELFKSIPRKAEHGSNAN